MLSPTVPKVLVTWRIDWPYVREVSRKPTLSEQILAYCSSYEKLSLGKESDSYEQKVNKYLLGNSAAYCGFKKVINA